MAEENQERETKPVDSRYDFVRVDGSRPTEAEKEEWANFDTILKDNRVRDALQTEAGYYSSVQFAWDLYGDPWAKGWGIFADDFLFDEWTEAISEYRREREAKEAGAFNQSATTGNQAEVEVMDEEPHFFVLDTDALTLWQNGNENLQRKRAEHERDLVAISIISAEEALGGWYNLLRRPAQNAPTLAGVYYRMTQTVSFLGSLPVVTFDEAAIIRFEQLRAMKLNIGHNDLRIAAIALQNNAVVVTRNVRDFERVPGLQIENWAD